MVKVLNFLLPTFYYKKEKAAVMCLKEKLQVSAKLPSGMTYRAVGQDLNVNESTIICKQKQHTEQDCVLTTGL